MYLRYFLSLINNTLTGRGRVIELAIKRFLKPYVALRWPASRFSGRGINVVLYFPDSPSNIYQIREWYRPLTALGEELQVAIITCDPSTYLLVKKEAPVPVVFQADFNDYETFFSSNKPELILYVNHNTNNLASMQWASSLTAFICHGESEKPYMTWGQVRAYDYFLVAGQASVARLRRRVPNYDVDSRAIVIGRPQCDTFRKHKKSSSPIVTALYCPTRESDRASMALSSVLPVGKTIVAMLLELGIRVIYRPHPCLGRDSSAHRRESLRIIRYIKNHNARLPRNLPPSIVDTSPEIGWQIAESTFCITDISAFGIDYLASAKPLIATIPISLSQQPYKNTFLDSAYKLRFDRVSDLPELVSTILTQDPLLSLRYQWSSYYFDGLPDNVPATPRFVKAVKDLVLQQRDEMRRLEQVAGKQAFPTQPLC